MNPETYAAVLPRSSGLFSKISGIKTDTSSIKSTTRIGNTKHDQKSSGLPSTPSRTKEKRRMEKRKKSRGSGHPSVVIATLWTNRQEQVEEVRAREAIYGAPRSDVPAVQASGTKKGPCAWWMERVRTDKSKSKPKAGRPWEWSAQDCEALMFNTTSHSDESGDRSPKSLETRVSVTPRSPCAVTPVRSANDATGDGLSKSNSVKGLGRDCKSAEESQPHVEPPARRVRGRCKGSTEMKMTEAIGRGKGFQSSSEVGTSTVSASGTCLVAEQGGMPVKRIKHSSASSSKATSKEGSESEMNDSDFGPSNPLSATSTRKDETENEQKARELSAALNRNHPRRGKSQWYGRDRAHSDESDVTIAELSAVDPKFEYSGKEDASGKEQLRGRGSNGKSERGTTFKCKRVAENSTPLENICDPAMSRKELKVHPWIKAGLKFGLGTTAEVWWDDGKWYRCRISKISCGGRNVELEFLPYRRKIIAREFSPDLDLDELIQDGHLVLPGTHLEWTKALNA